MKKSKNVYYPREPRRLIDAFLSAEFVAELPDRMSYIEEKLQAHGVEADIIRMIALRQKAGIAKYKTTVARNPLSLREWLTHALEESLDQAIYLRAAVLKLDQENEEILRDRSNTQGRSNSGRGNSRRDKGAHRVVQGNQRPVDKDRRATPRSKRATDTVAPQLQHRAAGTTNTATSGHSPTAGSFLHSRSSARYA